jgi:DNA processing protein
MPSTEDEIAASLTLAELARAGTQPWVEVMRRFGSASAVVAAADEELTAAGLTARALARLRSGSGHESAAVRIERCSARDIRIAAYGSDDYPALLRHVPDPPLVLFWRGVVAPSAVVPAAAIVGSRRATRYGLRWARRFGAAVARAGAWVVSGLAIGIDAAAQAPAADTGRGAAVLAGGVDRCYPAANRRLAERIMETGVILSEYPPGTPTLPCQFPIRNRIITGMARVTVVVEAALRSGSLVSARHAADQGRDVLAVPGPIDSPASQGANRLIQDGCRPLLDADELLEALGMPQQTRSAGSTRQRVEAAGDHVATAIFLALDDEPASADAIAQATGLDESVVLEKLTALELDGFAERLASGAYVRCARESEAMERS